MEFPRYILKSIEEKLNSNKVLVPSRARCVASEILAQNASTTSTDSLSNRAGGGKRTRSNSPKAFVEAYPEAETHWINRDNFIDFVNGEI
jgi:hypothetical protein